MQFRLSGNTRLTGIAVGNFKAELDAWPSSTPTAFNADLFFGYDPTGSGLPVGSYIFRAGQEVYRDTVNLNTGGATLSVHSSQRTMTIVNEFLILHSTGK